MKNRVRLTALCVVIAAGGCTCGKALHVVSASPSGALTDVPRVTRFEFDGPLYDPAHAIPKMAPASVRVSPAVPFTAALSSPTSVDVEFGAPLAPATEYTVTLLKGLQSADGKSVLKEDAITTFRTPGNRLERLWSLAADARLPDEELSVPADASQTGQIADLGPMQLLTLRFRFPVTLDQAKKFVTVFIKDGQPVPVNATVATPATDVILTPATRWPRDTSLVVTVAKGLGVGLRNAGALTTEAAQSAEIHSWGGASAKLVHSGDEKSCVPPKVLTLDFKNPVACESVVKSLQDPDRENVDFKCVSDQTARRVRVESRPPYEGESDGSLTLNGTYTDTYGEAATAPQTFKFTTCRLGTSFAYQKPFVILDPGQATEHVERVTGASALKVEGKRMELPALWALLRTQELSDQVAWTSLPWWIEYNDWGGEGEGWDGDGESQPEKHKLPGELSDAAVAELNGASTVTVPVKGDPAIKHGDTAWNDVSVGLKQFLGGKHGLVLLRTTPLGDAGKAIGPAALRVVNVTDIGLSARLSNDTLVVMAVRYSDGKPIPGAQISLQTEEGKAVGTGTTGDDGLMTLAATQLTALANLKEKPLLVVARKDDDESFVWTKFVSDREEQWWGHDGKRKLLGVIYPDRSIYRPGEKVHIHGVVRYASAKGFGSAAGQKGKLVISDPSWQEISSEDLTLSDFGTFNKELDVPASARLGNYSIKLTFDDAGQPLQGQYIVGEFRRAEMKVDVHAPTTLKLGDDLNATIQADYLFGAPAGGLDVRWSLTRETEHWSSLTAPDYEFYPATDDEYWSYYRDQTTQLADGTGTLDDKGAYVVSQSLALPDPVGEREIITLSATVEDKNGQSVSTQRSIDMAGAKIMVGLMQGNYLVEANKPTTVEIVTLNPDDTVAADVPVRVVTRTKSWRSVRRQGPSGGYYWTGEEIDTGKVERCTGKSDARGHYNCTFTPKEGGSLQIIASARAGKADLPHASSAIWRYVWGDPGYWGGGEHENQVTVLFDKGEVKAGETAHVAITSPFKQGYALVTVEREDILWKKAFPVGTTATIEIPTELAWAPDVQIVATVVRARVKSGQPDPEHDKPAYAIGRKELKVKPATSALEVKLAAAKPAVEPGQQQTVTATITRSDGTPAAGTEVNLWAVDEGVLMLTSYKTPDVLGNMFARRGWDTIGLDTRQYILGKRIFVEPVKKGDDGGGGGDENEGRLRKDFNPLAVWVGSAITNDQGVVQNTFTVPDTLTTYRVMAVAVSKDDRFGQGSAQFKVNKTLMLRQALPRFARPGDTFTAGVLVNHLATGPQDITVKLESFDDKLFAASGPLEQQVTVNPNETKAVLFQFSAKDADGTSAMHFAATMPGHQDRVELKVPVHRFIPRESVAVSGVLASGKLEQTLTVPKDAQPVAFEVSASGMPLSALEGRLKEMVHYPYGCLEQRTSQVMPLVAIRELAGKLDLKSIPRDQIKGWVAEWVTLVPKYRCDDGGFDYWPGCKFGASTYLSSFALDGMLTVRKYGFDVPQGEIDRTVEFLKHQVQTGSMGKDLYDGDGLVIDQMMSPLRVLAVAGSPLPDVEKASFDNRAALPIFARTELTRAIGSRLGAKAKDDANVKTLVTEIGSAGKPNNGALTFDAPDRDKYWWAWESQQRNTAEVLRMLVQVDPADGRIPLVLKGLVDLNGASEYYVTSDTTETLLGLVELLDQMDVAHAATSATIKASGETLATATALGAKESTFTLPVEKIHGTIPFELDNTGSSPVYFGANLSYSYRPDVRLPAADNGFGLTRTYADEHGNALPITTKDGHSEIRVHVGDFVSVKVEAKLSSDGRLALFEDPLPAGLEPVDTSLATSDKETVRRIETKRRSWWSEYQRELHDDRVEWHYQYIYGGDLELSYVARATTAGTFHAPGAHAERMYQPSINGRSSAVDFVVLPREN
jgi:uncharacterized protein YfaS (alpha-2-macroglobulin family)